MAPQTRQRSERPGEAGVLLDTPSFLDDAPSHCSVCRRLRGQESTGGSVAMATELARNVQISWWFAGSAPALLNSPSMMRRGFFLREVEVFLQVMGCALVFGAFVLTFAWGYTQRQNAEAWRVQACTYRFADLARRATFLGDDTRDACTRLQSLGLGLRTSAIPAGSDFARP